MILPPGDKLQAEARHCIEHHHHWGSPAMFGVLRWNRPAGTLDRGIWVAIDRDREGNPIGSAYWGALMSGLADGELQRCPGDPPAAFVFGAEAYTGPAPPPHASLSEKTEFYRQLAAGQLAGQDGTAEKAVAFCTDFTGRTWHAEHTRADPRTITETYYPPGDAPGWPELQNLITIATSIGVTAWGVPLIIPAPPR